MQIISVNVLYYYSFKQVIMIHGRDHKINGILDPRDLDELELTQVLMTNLLSIGSE